MKNCSIGPGVRASLIALSSLVGIASVAWACTAQPRIFSLGPQVGPVGLQITLEGEAAGGPVAVPGQSGAGVPVEVRWNSIDGPKIGESVARLDGSFAVSARIPQAEPGVYFLLVKAGDAGVVRSPFEVTGEKPVGGAARPANSSADLWRGFSTSTQVEQPGSLAAQEGTERSGMVAIGAALVAAGATALALSMVLSRRGRKFSGTGGDSQS